ncbi:MAG: MFS transporter [Pseudomonadales bacterium RIFCSPLOWO2_12_60_38]|jgi:MFS family permease|uniref:MFS transporter n=3 Tax=Pseudomonas TaxID=286 RepID=A0ABS9FSC7_9PSED|nr:MULTISPECIES: MFS transporter [Pseudomonas]AFJ58403.1 transporter, major facilitator family [Pseudomonas fluorescens A506]ETK43473.1 MFS transporter [Pseudomonas fluorescens FH5]MBD8258422.1 MHS family MFS transporter [Pseudomonas fluorescens]MDN5398279.1 MHS family MFS transporter [Pseudomonas sp.]MDN5427688.1 MHS family MFS transporter [Pseudomonadales bacterium]OHC32291.1 MAG: MFS transporter [Pseudomonadales bacterium RIFCSPLOWO2_12_60_38]OHC38275.1 MAG: MFS transporter [Pseudomonadal
MSASASIPGTETPEQTRKRLRKVAAATIFGSMLEWYDFYLYATMAAIVFSKIFFDNSDPKTATLMAFSTFAIGFIARPFGGILFGYLGDKFGRKQVLVLTFCLMGVCTTLIGLIPSYASIGIWAPILLVFIRIIQGLGAGAELSGAAVTSYEHASQGKRGSQGAWPALGLNLGLLLSSLTIYLLTINGNEFLLAGGWRIPFICSIVLVGVGLWVRNSIPETPQFEALSTEKAKAKPSPLKALFKNDLKGLAVVFFVAIGYNALSYIFKTFSLAYLTQFKGVDVHVTSLSVTIASLVAIVAVPCFGWLCDKWSSKTVLMLGGLCSLLFAYPFLALLNSGESLMIYLAIGVGTGILAPMMFAPQGSFLSRQFPTQTRSSGFGTGREIGTAIAGGLAPLGALSMVAASATHSTDGVVVILAISALLVVVFALCDQGAKHSTFKN